MPLNTLPGVKAELIDGQLRPVSVPTQPKITLIGTCNNPNVGPGEPIRLESDDDAAQFDNKLASDSVTLDPTGPISKPSELSKAITEAFNGGGDNVEVFVIPDDNDQSVKLGVDAIPQERYDSLDGAYDLLKFTTVDIVTPVGATIDATGLASTDNFAYQLANFCHQAFINERGCIGTIGLSPAVAGNNIPTLAQQEAWVAAAETFDTSGILGADFTIGDGVTFTGADARSQGPDTYAFWATSDEAIPIGAPTPRFDSDVETDKKGFPVDIGKYICVVADTVRFINEQSGRENPTGGFYHANAATAYTGMIANRPARIGTTNDQLRGAVPVRALAPSQAERLESKRFTTFLNRPTGFVCANGVTWGHRISDQVRTDYTQLTTMRIALDAVAFVRARVMRYIGQPNNAQVRASINSDVDEALSVMQRLGALQGYDFRVNSSASQQILGQMTIDIRLQPAFEIRTVTVSTSLTAQAL